MLTDRDVLDGLSAGVVIARQDEVATHANPAACRMLQRSIEGCITQPVPLLLGLPTSLRDHGLEAPGSECRLELDLPVGRAGATVQNVAGRGFACLFRPYTEGRAADLQVLRLEHESAVSAIVAAFAHEIRNPLAAIAAAAEMLQAEVPAAFGAPHFAIIERQVRRLTALAHGPAALGRPSTTQRVLCEVDQLVGAAIAAAVTDARQRGVSMRVALVPELPRVSVGERELIDALVEVIENAIHASASGGVVSVTAHRVATAPGMSPRVAIEIADAGSGLTPSDVSESLRLVTTSKANAIGSGLAVAHRHILDSGGRLAIVRPSRGGMVVRIEMIAEEGR